MDENPNPFLISMITLYPEMFPGSLGHSLAGRARDKGLWQLDLVALRDFGEGKHRQVDDTPAGGGAGMVLKPNVLAAAIDHASNVNDTRPRLLMSPRGRLLDQQYIRELAMEPGVVIVCGRFEGVDERVIEKRNLQEVSIGDYVLSGGEPAALALLDAIIRLLPGVMGNSVSGQYESHESGTLEHPHYTRPQSFEGQEIPDILLSGNHQNIDTWRQERSVQITREKRPDLFSKLDEKES
ncbi:MAG: tRNA (guanosine(37)-N1)-methyltransferase TrmD [Hyphomicrobiales bacterium]|nr:tRNA (guanosine(37)-N1)-methyltransferase TrmD [Hyphomicrobiales bacterium]